MRLKVDKDKLSELIKEMGQAAKSEGNCYFTGGVSAVLNNFREMTIDVDLKFDPEPLAIFEAIPKIKKDLSLNIELASPDQFIPELEGWRERSKFIEKSGNVSFYHYDYIAQALAKLERGHRQDIQDVDSMFKAGLIGKREMLEALESIKDKLIRYPAIEADEYILRVKKYLENQ